MGTHRAVFNAMLAIHALYPSPRNISLKARRFTDQLIASFGAEPPWDRAPAPDRLRV
jgi:hypothetical protein